MAIITNRIIAIVPILYFLTFAQISFGQNEGLFESEEILEITLKGDARSLFKNTEGESIYFDFLLSYSDSVKKTDLPLRVRTRGHFRRTMNICSYPPLLLNFSSDEKINSIFSGQNKLKLVMPCQGEKFVMREYYAYKLYNILTPESFKVRLVRLTIEDQSEKPKEYDSFLCFLIEEEDQMAGRNQMTILDKDLVIPEAIAEKEFIRMAVFQYLIANTDWSIQYRQNIVLINSKESGRPIAVPYDFDHSGIVNAPYAKPAPELKLASVTNRRYRGYCVEDMDEFQKTFSDFIAKKTEIYALYNDSKMLDEKYIKSNVKFLDDFYTTITNSKRSALDFQYPCQPGGTGNVVIKGLN